MLSCSGLVRKVATNTTADLTQEGSVAPYAINDYDFFARALPANIVFLESLQMNSPNNSLLFGQIIKAYGSYGFGYGETEMIKRARSLQYSDMRPHAEMATQWYAKATRVGDQWFQSKDSSLAAFLKQGPDDESRKKYLHSLFSSGDATGLFYLGQAWASYLNFHRDRPELVAQLPAAKVLVDFACEKNPDLDFGACQLFHALYLLSRPRMLGGNPKQGEVVINQLCRKYPSNLLYQLAKVQYVLLPQERTAEVQSSLNSLRSQLQQWDRSRFQLSAPRKDTERYTQLFNAIAYERFQALPPMKKGKR